MRGNGSDAIAWTQVYITDMNHGQSGGNVHPTYQASWNSHNRGAWSQWGSAELAFVWPDSTFDYTKLLRWFYGADVAIGKASSGGGGDPCAHVASSANGVYCGATRESGFAGGSASTLYTCQNGRTASTQSCAAGCYVAPAGQSDGCVGNPCAHVAAVNNGLYCGSSTQNGFAYGAPGTLYNCVGGRVASARACAHGCTVAPAGQSDSCY